MTDTFSAPAGLLESLGDGGRTLVESILDDLAGQGLVPDAREVALLRTAGELRDRMDELSRLVGTDGERSVSESGIVRLHPAIAEGRQCAVALSKVLASIGMADTAGKAPRHQRAAQKRWADDARRRGA